MAFVGTCPICGKSIYTDQEFVITKRGKVHRMCALRPQKPERIPYDPKRFGLP